MFENECGLCEGELTVLGILGSLIWFQCRNCGMQFSGNVADYPEVVEAMQEQEA